MSEKVTARIERILREQFQPVHFELRDDSHKHVGHAGAASGGGHFHVVIVAQAFEGKNRLQQHRLVHAALDDLLGNEIHALGLTTRAPSER